MEELKKKYAVLPDLDTRDLLAQRASLETGEAAVESC
jgi:hypothetical protein